MNKIILLGFLGQFFFFMRFFVQWICSERAKKSVIPGIFWIFSLLGSVILLIYSILVHDVVFAVGTAFGTLIYLRNLWFVIKDPNRSLIL